MHIDDGDAEARALLHDELLPALVGALDAGPRHDDAAALEHAAAGLLPVLDREDVPPEVPAAVLQALERRGDERAAGVLAALAVLSGEPLAGQARAAVERLADAGIVAAAAARLGTLAVREAVRMVGGEGELLVALLRREGGRKAQLAVLAFEHAEGGGALVGCTLTEPVAVGEARSFLAGKVRGADALRIVPITAPELAERAATLARRAVDADLALDHASAAALPIVARALTGDPRGLPRPRALPPWEDDDEELVVDAAEDEDGFHAVLDLLRDELEQYAVAAYTRGSAVWAHGDFVAGAMLEWKGAYADGRLGRWTPEDLAECLLDHFPRKVSLREDGLAAVPDCAIALLRSLDAHHRLSGAPLELLEETCGELRDAFAAQMRDPSLWGLAKTMAMGMYADGLDPADAGAAEAFTAAVNERLARGDRTVLGGALHRIGAERAATVAAAAAPSDAAKSRRRGQRKEQRAARRRSRRHH